MEQSIAKYGNFRGSATEFSRDYGVASVSLSSHRGLEPKVRLVLGSVRSTGKSSNQPRLSASRPHMKSRHDPAKRAEPALEVPCFSTPPPHWAQAPTTAIPTCSWSGPSPCGCRSACRMVLLWACHVWRVAWVVSGWFESESKGTPLPFRVAPFGDKLWKVWILP